MGAIFIVLGMTQLGVDLPENVASQLSWDLMGLLGGTDPSDPSVFCALPLPSCRSFRL